MYLQLLFLSSLLSSSVYMSFCYSTWIVTHLLNLIRYIYASSFHWLGREDEGRPTRMDKNSTRINFISIPLKFSDKRGRSNARSVL